MSANLSSGANAFGQACKRVPNMAFVHVNAFAFVYGRACLRVRNACALYVASRSLGVQNAFETHVRYTLHLGGTVCQPRTHYYTNTLCRAVEITEILTQMVCASQMNSLWVEML